MAAKRAIMNEFLNLIDYQTQLGCLEWQKKRNQILNRDSHRCQICGKGKSSQVRFNDQCWNIGIDYSNSSSEVLPVSLSVSDFKNLVHAEALKIVKYRNDNHLLVGISDNGVLGVMNADNTPKLQSPDNLRINLIKHPSGLLSFVVRDKDISSDCINVEYSVYLSETPIVLNVHHKHYIIQHKAWEYLDEDLVTLCNECHTKIHQAIGVKVYSDENGYMRHIPLTPCARCYGAGYFPEYKHVENGICFRCRGARFEELIKEQQ